MALDKRLLEILCCPVTKQPVVPLTSRQLEALERTRTSQGLSFVDGSVVQKAVAAGLLTRDAKTIYVIDDGIPVMLAEQAIQTSQIADFAAT